MQEDPAFVYAQNVLIGRMLADRGEDISQTVWATIRATDLDPPYRQVAEAAHGLHARSVPVNSLAVIDEMQKRGSLGRVGGMAEVMKFAEHSFGDPHAAIEVISRVSRQRRLAAIGMRTLQESDSGAEPYELASKVVAAAQGVIDGIEAEGDVTTPSLGEFLAREDDPYDWVIPGLLEHSDRLILTGEEGLGKSELCRQIAICAAAGIHPFTHSRFEPARVLYVDCENGPAKLKRKLRPLREAARRTGADPAQSMWLETIPAGLDLTKPEDELWLTRRVAALQPDLLVTGPIYRLHAANPNDEEPARKVTAVLDRCRAASNCALMTEAHTSLGHAGGERPLRPTGTSLWLRWPEFGYGIRRTEDFTFDNRQVRFQSWRGDREARAWPVRLRAGTLWPWEDDDPEHGSARPIDAVDEVAAARDARQRIPSGGA